MTFSITDYLSSASFWVPERIIESAWIEHGPFAFWLIESLRPDLIVELGTHHGFSYLAFCQAVDRLELPTKCFAVDTWQGDEHAGFYGEEVLKGLKSYHDERYGRFSQLIRSTFDEAAAYFQEGSVDLLHIDGRHYYDDVKHDFLSWRPKLSDRGVVLFHDINVRERNFGVVRLWEELRSECSSFEFDHGHGLGILALGKEAPDRLRPLFEPNSPPDRRHAIKGVYARLGASLAARLMLAQMRETVASQATRLEKLHHELEELGAQRTRELESLHKDMDHKFALIGQREMELEALRGKLTEREQEIARIRELEVAHLVAAKEAQVRAEVAVRKIDALLHSTSWRVTRALRGLGRLRNMIFHGERAHVPRILLRILSARDQEQQNVPAPRLSKQEACTQQRAEPAEYRNWVVQFDDHPERDRAAYEIRVATLPRRPFFSVLMPVYETPAPVLEEAIASVVNQIYPDWELCIADDASKSPHVAEILARWTAADKRIKVIRRAENGHIAHATNSAFELAEGEYIALLDHDDLLRPHALAEVAFALNLRPDAEIIYSDEDKIDQEGVRRDPYFKPDWSPDLFLSQNYLNHLTVHRSQNIRDVGGWRPGTEGSQDYDLILRIIERIDHSRIIHIPKVLYHWRIVPGSTALAGEEKDYAFVAATRALTEHLERTGADARVTDVPGLLYHRVERRVPEPAPLASLVIPTRDRADLLRMCLNSVRELTSYKNFEILVVDNRSAEENTFRYFEELKSDGRVRVIRYDKPFNYSAINNFAVCQARGSLLCFMNNDIEVIAAEWLSEMVSQAMRPEIGCVGAKLYYPNDTIQHAGVILGIGGVAGHSHKYFPRAHHGYFGRLCIVQNVSAVTGACLVVRRSVFDEVGGLDEENLAIAFNDVDFCLKVREAGYRNLWTPFAELYHHESVSRGHEDTPEKMLRFQREVDVMRKRWATDRHTDPYYSPHLTREREDFSIRGC